MLSSHPDVYARNLLPLNRGYPLWTTESSDQLSTCRRGGIDIGDVGVVVPENGSFDVFFNICLPRDHPLHKANGVPDNFSPIKLDHEDVEFSNAERPGCILSSPSVKREKATKTPPDDEGPPRSTNEFRLYSGEGAILILPEGADFYDLRDKTHFREMAIRHGAEWYKFAMDHLRRLIRHDSLYLITGYNSTRSCSLASFQDAEGYTARFTVQNVGGRDDYSWQSKCSDIEWRNGQADDKSETPNRAVFIQGFKIDLKSGFLGTEVSVTMDPPRAKEERHDYVHDPIVMDLTGSITPEDARLHAGGAYADVYKGTCRIHKETMKVAIKAVRGHMITSCDSSKIKKRLRREITVWSVLDHANILRLIGTTTCFGPLPAMVCSWAENGTLTHYLECPSRKLKTVQTLSLLHDVASGLHYLHSMGIVHGDLSGANVLIDASGRALLSDFGLSTILEEVARSVFVSSMRERGTLRWAAPESLGLPDPDDADQDPIAPSTQSDVYAFGSLMLQILSGKVPYHYYNSNQVLSALVQRICPRRPDNECITDRRWTFIEQCWFPPDMVELRPSSKEIIQFCKSELRSNTLPHGSNEV